jgi:hypothetical protein
MCPAGHNCPYARSTHGSSISISSSSSSSDSGGDYSGGGGGAAPSTPACSAGDACLGREWPLSQPLPPVFEARFADKLCVEASRDCFDTVHVPHKMELVHYEACSGVTMLGKLVVENKQANFRFCACFHCAFAPHAPALAPDSYRRECSCRFLRLRLHVLNCHAQVQKINGHAHVVRCGHTV